MKLFILCLLISACYSFDFDCLKGPDYWCSNLSNAQKCGKVTECFMNKKKPLDFKIDDLFSCSIKNGGCCDLCTQLVTVLESELPKMTEEQFVDILIGNVCSRLAENVRSVCRAMATEYGPTIYQTIKTDLNPQKVCGFIRMCPSGGEPSLFSVLKGDSTDMCTRCKEIFQVLESLFTKVSPDEFKFILENLICLQLPSEFRMMCKTMIDGYATQLYELIKSFLDGDRICPLLHLCPSNKTRRLGGWSCQTCLDVVPVLKKDLNGVSIGDIENMVNNMVCSKLSRFIRGICHDYVSNLVPKFMNELNSGMTPQQICQQNELCTAPPLRKLLIKKPDMKGIECDACHMVVNKLKEFISNPSRETAIKNFIKNRICNLFPSEKIQCQQFIDEFFTIIMNFVISEMDVDKICRVMNMCSTKLKSPVTCDVCELVMNEVIIMATSNKTESVVSNFLISEVCSHLGFVKEECIDSINTYLPAIFSLARSTLNSKVLCRELKLCTLISIQKINLVVKNTNLKTIKCEVCQLVVNETKLLLVNPTIQKKIEDFLIKEICSRMGSKQQECTNDITQYYSFVINIIVEFLNPSLCVELRLCSSQNRLQKIQPMIEILKPSKTNHCQLCINFYKYLQSITSPKPRTHDVLAVLGLCDQINELEKAQCLKYFRNFDSVIKSFNKSKNIGQFCQMTNMCSKHKTPVLGSNSCTWGPGFWCISRAHALACGPGAVKHCEMKVWNKIPIF